MQQNLWKLIPPLLWIRKFYHLKMSLKMIISRKRSGEYRGCGKVLYSKSASSCRINLAACVCMLSWSRICSRWHWLQTAKLSPLLMKLWLWEVFRGLITIKPLDRLFSIIIKDPHYLTSNNLVKKGIISVTHTKHWLDFKSPKFLMLIELMRNPFI